MQKNMTATFSKTYRAFTLIEVVMALFVFSLMTLAVSQVFASAFSGYRSTRIIEHNLERAQFFMNILAKELRTSSVVAPTGSLISSQSVKFFDHSQNRCFLYRISGSTLQVASSSETSVANCSAASLSSFAVISTGTISGTFRVTSSATAGGGPATRVGKVTISLVVSDGTAHQSHMQTTVSLRDFGNIGL